MHLSNCFPLPCFFSGSRTNHLASRASCIVWHWSSRVMDGFFLLSFAFRKSLSDGQDPNAGCTGEKGEKRRTFYVFGFFFSTSVGQSNMISNLSSILAGKNWGASEKKNHLPKVLRFSWVLMMWDSWLNDSILNCTVNCCILCKPWKEKFPTLVRPIRTPTNSVLFLSDMSIV